MSDSQDIEIKEPYKPELVSGVFTVNGSGKKVKFAKGNLYWNGSEFRCEDTQYAYPTTRNVDHIVHFFWSKTASVAYAARYIDPSISTYDKFFAADGGAIEGFTVLSKDEWQYLNDNAIAEKQTTIDGKTCTVLKPDGFDGTVADSYTAAEWATAEASGLVALPFAGYYNSFSIDISGGEGRYWSSNPVEDDAIDCWYTKFSLVDADSYFVDRSFGHSVRLVQVVE